MTELLYTEADRDLYEDTLAKREVNYRRNHNIEVFIYWHKKSGILSLALRDLGLNQELECEIDPSERTEAFEHPYPALYRRGMDFDYSRRIEEDGA